jgi:simple sugar transport system permease protein
LARVVEEPAAPPDAPTAPGEPPGHSSRRFDRRQAILRTGRSVGEQLVAFILAMALLIAVLWILGFEPSAVTRALWDGSMGSSAGLRISFTQAAPLILTATAVWLTFQCGLFNVGADGQLQIGGLAAVAVLVSLPAELPGLVLTAAGLAAAVAAGAVWAAIAGLLRAYRGADEVVATIMLNFIAFRLLDIMMSGPLRSSTARFTPQSERIPTSAELHSVFGTPIAWTMLIAAGLAVLTIVAMGRTTLGLRVRGIGLNEDAARHAAVPVEKYRVWSFVLSGAVSGLAGGLAIVGLRFLLSPGWAPIWGFSGILIAFLAVRSPLMIPVWGVIFGMIAAAGPVLKGSASVPDAVTTIMQTLPVVVLFVLYTVVRWVGTARQRVASRLEGRPSA